jgi:hypothetical protein
MLGIGMSLRCEFQRNLRKLEKFPLWFTKAVSSSDPSETRTLEFSMMLKNVATDCGTNLTYPA